MSCIAASAVASYPECTRKVFTAYAHTIVLVKLLKKFDELEVVFRDKVLQLHHGMNLQARPLRRLHNAESDVRVRMRGFQIIAYIVKVFVDVNILKTAILLVVAEVVIAVVTLNKDSEVVLTAFVTARTVFAVKQKASRLLCYYDRMRNGRSSYATTTIVWLQCY